MSRALNLDATQAHVRAMCAKHDAPITQIETLASGGTRVVLQSVDDAAILARAYRKSVIAGPIVRQPTRLARA
jgi:hypothetical protein